MQDVLAELLESDQDLVNKLQNLLTQGNKGETQATFQTKLTDCEIGEIVNIDHLEGGLTIN